MWTLKMELDAQAGAAVAAQVSAWLWECQIRELEVWGGPKMDEAPQDSSDWGALTLDEYAELAEAAVAGPGESELYSMRVPLMDTVMQ